MGTLITLFSPPLEQKILRPEACRQGREEGSSSVKRVKIDPPSRGWEWPCWCNLHSLSKALEWLLLPAVPHFPVPRSCAMGQLVGWRRDEVCVLFQPSGTLGKERTPENKWGGAQRDRMPA